LDIENPIEESLSIEWISIDYDQVENKLFLQLEILHMTTTLHHDTLLLMAKKIIYTIMHQSH